MLPAAAALLPSLLLTGCGRKPVRGRPVAPGALVLALGDSRTHGTGAPPEAAYPAVLADEALRADAIHANARGHEAFARGPKATAQASGLLSR